MLTNKNLYELSDSELMQINGGGLWKWTKDFCTGFWRAITGKDKC